MSDVVNGSFQPVRTKEDRHAFAPGMALTVKGDGATACFRRCGIKWPGGRRVVMLAGQINNVKAFVHTDDDGVLHVTMTCRDMAV